MKRIIWPLMNSIVLVITLFINYWTNTGAYNGKKIGEISDQYSNLFTPAGYAFSIWGFIYLFLIAFVGYQWYVWRKEPQNEVLEKTGIWFAVANLANAFWVMVFLNDQIGLSVVIMLILLVSLIVLVLRLDMERWDAPIRIIAFVWWPISWYIGWIILASVTNISAWLVSIGRDGSPLSQQTWTIILIAMATLIYVILIVKRNMREASLIGIWGLIAIAVKQWDFYPIIVYAALASAFVLVVASGYHGFKNRKTSPVVKWRNGEV